MQNVMEINKAASADNGFTREISSFTKYVGPRGELSHEIQDNPGVQVGTSLTRNIGGFLNPRIPERAAVNELRDKTTKTSRLLGLMNMAEQLGAINMGNVDEEEFARNCKMLGTINAYSRVLTLKFGKSKYNQNVFANPKAAYEFFEYSQLIDRIIDTSEEFFRTILVNDGGKLAEILEGMLDSPLSQSAKDETLGQNRGVMDTVLRDGERVPFASEALDTFAERDLFRLATYFSISG